MHISYPPLENTEEQWVDDIPSRKCGGNTSAHVLEVVAPKTEIGRLHNQQPLQPVNITGEFLAPQKRMS